MSALTEQIRDLLARKVEIGERWAQAHREVIRCENEAMRAQRRIPVGTAQERNAAWAAWEACHEQWDAALNALEAIQAESRANTAAQVALLAAQ